jgi:excisionase family DNA binding protein
MEFEIQTNTTEVQAIEVERLTYTIKETAKALGISYQSAYKLIKSGKIPSVRMGKRRLLVSKEDLMNTIKTGITID